MTIPRIVKPYITPPRRSLFPDFAASIHQSQDNVKNFRKEYEGRETQDVLQHARRRLKDDGDMGLSGDVPRYGWVERHERRKDGGKSAVEKVEESSPVIGDEEVKRTVSEWRGRNERLGIVETEGGRDLMVCCAC
jgi:hypothetical protein